MSELPARGQNARWRKNILQKNGDSSARLVVQKILLRSIKKNAEKAAEAAAVFTGGFWTLNIEKYGWKGMVVWKIRLLK